MLRCVNHSEMERWKLEVEWWPLESRVNSPRAFLSADGMKRRRSQPAAAPPRDERVYLVDKPCASICRIDAWPMHQCVKPGPFRDSQGYALSGFLLLESDLCMMLVVRDGNVTEEFCFPSLEEPLPFQSPLVRWRNLAYRGGPGCILFHSDETALDTDTSLMEDVITGKKPMGFAFLPGHYPIDELVHRATASKLPFIVKRWYSNRHVEVAIAQRGTIAEVFGDLNPWIMSYRRLGKCFGQSVLSEEDEKDLLTRRLRPTRPLLDFLTDWDYANPKSASDFVLTGLLLGYPIESTFHLLVKNHAPFLGSPPPSPSSSSE